MKQCAKFQHCIYNTQEYFDSDSESVNFQYYNAQE